MKFWTTSRKWNLAFFALFAAIILWGEVMDNSIFLLLSIIFPAMMVSFLNPTSYKEGKFFNDTGQEIAIANPKFLASAIWFATFMLTCLTGILDALPNFMAFTFLKIVPIFSVVAYFIFTDNPISILFNLKSYNNSITELPKTTPNPHPHIVTIPFHTFKPASEHHINYVTNPGYSNLNINIFHRRS
jgi:hypothetical protein